MHKSSKCDISNTSPLGYITLFVETDGVTLSKLGCSSMLQLDAPQSYVIVFECLSILDTLASGCADRNCVQRLFSMKENVSFSPCYT